MKFIASSSQLLKQLQSVSGIINNNNALTILDNFLFELDGNKLKISASDLESIMSTELEVQSDEGGSIAVSARLLLDVLKTFPDQPLTFMLDEAAKHVEISSEYGKYEVAYEDAADFPTVPEIEDAEEIDLDVDMLSTAVAKTIFATGTDELRPVMSGIYFEFDKGGINFVATDAHKLVRYRRTDHKGVTAKLIMPRKPLSLLRSALTGDGKVKLRFNEKNAHFSFDSINLSCRLIEGKYPNYEAVIPKENPNMLSLDRNAFLGSVKRVSIFSNKTTHQVRLKVAGAELQISAEDLDFNNKADERLTCQYQGDDMQIGFNSRFLVEMLSNLESDVVTLEMSEPNRAGILKPADGLAKGEEILMLVMPVMLNN